MKISRRESAALINSLTAGVTPRTGLRHIAVGRKDEVGAFLSDLETVEDGGAAFRFVCGQYGSGKSFLLQLIRHHAMERGFAVMDADLSPERRLTGTKGQGLATYRELLANFAAQARPDGGALEAVMQKWLSRMQAEAACDKNADGGEGAIVEEVGARIAQALAELSEMPYGSAFANIVGAYWRAVKTGDDALRAEALRWLRAEFATKTEARHALQADSIIEDANWYEFLKLLARFVQMAGYKGLIVFLDEGVNLYKIANKQARESNYEKLLTVFNDAMQGKARGIGVFMGGTEQFIYDERRGLFSYEALRSRLVQSKFAVNGYADRSGPVIRLEQLSAEEMFVLLERLCELHSAHYSYECGLGQAELRQFLQKEKQRLGAESMLTPRELTRDMLGLLNILHQNPEAQFAHLIGNDALFGKDEDEGGGSEYAGFEL